MAELSYVGDVSERIAHSPAKALSPDALIGDLLHWAVVLTITLFALPLMVVIAAAIHAQDGGPFCSVIAASARAARPSTA